MVAIAGKPPSEKKCSNCGGPFIIHERCIVCLLLVRHDFVEEEIVDRTRLPDRPTRALPGSKEKIRVLSERYQQKVCLYHPDDAKINDGTTLD